MRLVCNKLFSGSRSFDASAGPIARFACQFVRCYSVPSGLRPLVEELEKSHEYAGVAQKMAVEKTDEVRRKLAMRSGDTARLSTTEPYEIKPFNQDELNVWGLEDIREQDIQEIKTFLMHQRQYKVLLDRYQSIPEDGLDRVNATAKRVGLDASKL